MLYLPTQKLSDFFDAARKAYPDDLARGGTALIKFLVYVLTENFGKSVKLKRDNTDGCMYFHFI